MAWTVTGGVADLTRPRQAPAPVAVSARPQHLVIDANRTACVVIDMQNDFCSPDGWLASIGVDTTPLVAPIAPLRTLLPELRSAGVPVIWVNWGNRPDRADLPPAVIHVYDHDGTGTGIGDPLPSTGARVLEKGSPSAELVDGLVAERGDIAVDKTRMTGFADTELDSILRNLDVSTVLFCGVNLDQCVLATLMDGAALGYDCVVVEDCCATSSPPSTIEATLYNIAQCFGFVTDSGALVDGLGAMRSPPRAEVVRAGDRTAYRITAGDSVKLVPMKTPGPGFDASVFLEVWDPGGAQPPNAHPVSVETFFILEGSGVAYSDADEFPVAAGDFIVLPAGTVHRIVNSGATRLYAVTTMQPDAGFTALVSSGVPEPIDEFDRPWVGIAAPRTSLS
ncbi:MAG TPA: isochorismatase family protein [Acidimicrobiales bacterium]|nr:isochorismatase family protein [Acidimicrobiales bacterium]